ncbi:hypothetical protein UlMin_039239 [Ulmus minor]
MRKRSASHDLGTFPSPGAPTYRGNGIGCQKGWTSERVPAPGAGAGRHIGSGPAAMMFNSGRTLPSKWEDAERWICSPISGYGIGKISHSSQPQKRPKSKSGPIDPKHSPAIEGGSLKNFMVSSPFSTGVLLAAESVYSGQVYSLASFTGSTEMRENSYCPSPKMKNQRADHKDGEILASRGVPQRDMGTQMSPKDCMNSNRGRSSLSSSSPPALLSIMEQQSENSGKLEVRDVQVDKRATVIRGSRRRGSRSTKKSRPSVAKEAIESAMEISSSFDISEAAMDDSKLKREEAKIIAWENLQKAKAEAAIRKLEMKLEKKRSASMDKILDKLKTAEFRGHKMRSKVTTNESHQGTLATTPWKRRFSFHKHVRVGSLGRCFTCRVL